MILTPAILSRSCVAEVELLKLVVQSAATACFSFSGLVGDSIALQKETAGIRRCRILDSKRTTASTSCGREAGSFNHHAESERHGRFFSRRGQAETARPRRRRGQRSSIVRGQPFASGFDVVWQRPDEISDDGFALHAVGSCFNVETWCDNYGWQASDDAGSPVTVVASQQSGHAFAFASSEQDDGCRHCFERAQRYAVSCASHLL